MAMSVMWKVAILAVTVAMSMAILVAATPDEGHGRFLLQETSSAHVMGKRRLLNERCGGSEGVCKLKGEDVRCCAGVCKDVDRDDDYCGDCNTKCTKNSFGWKCCAGKCVNILTDANNCLFCGKQCSSGKPCQGGMCGYNSM